PRADRLHRSDGPDDEPPGAVVAALAVSDSVGQLRGRLHESPDLALDAQHDDVLGARDARACPLERPGRVRPRAPALAGPAGRVHGRARRAHAAAADLGGAALRDVVEVAAVRPPLRGDALAGDHPELARGRILDLP